MFFYASTRAHDQVTRELRAWMQSARMDPAWLSDVEAVLRRQRVSFQAAPAVEGDRLFARAYVANFFSDTALTRFGRLSPQFLEFTSRSNPRSARGVFGMRLGNYRENIAEIDARFDLFEGGADAEAWERVATPLATIPRTSLGLVDPLTSHSQWYSTLRDRVLADRRGFDLWIAIERCRAETGVYPESLDELEPKWISAVPMDPWTGMPALYRPVDVKSDPHARSFVLYFAGPDGTDHGGQGIPLDQPRGGASGDFVVNDPRR
jgi:hypothetical protein